MPNTPTPPRRDSGADVVLLPCGRRRCARDASRPTTPSPSPCSAASPWRRPLAETGRRPPLTPIAPWSACRGSWKGSGGKAVAAAALAADADSRVTVRASGRQPPSGAVASGAGGAGEPRTVGKAGESVEGVTGMTGAEGAVAVVVAAGVVGRRPRRLRREIACKPPR